MAKKKSNILESAFGQKYTQARKIVTLIRENVPPAVPWYPGGKTVYAGKKKRPQTKEEQFVVEHRKRFPEIINVNRISFSDFYTDADLTARLPKWNPAMNPEPIFHRNKDGRLGMTLIFLDDTTGIDREEIMIWRDSAGEIMEILYALTIINGKILDKRYHEYKFATPDGVQNLFMRYMELLRDAGEESYLNIVKQRLAFTAGMIKAVCQESVWKCFDMLIAVDDICDDCMQGVVNELIGIPGGKRTDNQTSSTTDKPDEKK